MIERVTLLAKVNDTRGLQCSSGQGHKKSMNVSRYVDPVQNITEHPVHAIFGHPVYITNITEFLNIKLMSGFKKVSLAFKKDMSGF